MNKKKQTMVIETLHSINIENTGVSGGELKVTITGLNKNGREVKVTIPKTGIWRAGSWALKCKQAVEEHEKRASEYKNLFYHNLSIK